MLTLKKSFLPAPEATLRDALVRYKAALEDHKTTEGVPAPWPDYLILRDVILAGGDFVVVDDVATAPLPLPEFTQEQKEAEAQRRFDTDKLFRAKCISDLAWRLGKNPGALTSAELLAERNRIANIYKAL